jgi:hypothetical protein
MLASAPTFAAEGQRRRGEGRERTNQASEERERTGRAVPRAQVEARQQPDGNRQNVSPSQPNRQSQTQQYRQVQPQYRSNYRPVQPQYRGGRVYDTRPGYAYHSYQRPYYPYYANRGYGARTIIVPRYITPRYVSVVPYAPYVYRPSIGIGVYYGAGGSYPYGYTPRAYYDPIPGQPYGGLRITGAPSRLAQVFADGYYVGIVNDFDGIFQHLNLEAGPHRIEIVDPAFPSIVFDVMIQPGRTVTYRVD